MPKCTIAVLVKNEFGVLNRVTSMFRRRQFNINSLTVSETETDNKKQRNDRITGDDLGDAVVLLCAEGGWLAHNSICKPIS